MSDERLPTATDMAYPPDQAQIGSFLAPPPTYPKTEEPPPPYPKKTQEPPPYTKTQEPAAHLLSEEPPAYPLNRERPVYPPDQEPLPYQPRGLGAPYGAQQQIQSVVVNQPVAVASTEVVTKLVIFAVMFGGLSVGVLTFCLWVLPFSIAGMFLGISSGFANESGEYKRAKTRATKAIVCTITAWIAAVGGIAVIVVAALASW